MLILNDTYNRNELTNLADFLDNKILQLQGIKYESIDKRDEENTNSTLFGNCICCGRPLC